MIEAHENGKPLFECEIETQFTAKILRYYAGWADKIKSDRFPAENTVGFTKSHPVGVCGQIIPWNYPFLMATWKIAPVLATGCTAVLKPSDMTPLTSLKWAEILLESGMPEGVINVLPGFGHDCGEAMVNHPDIAKIAFTGSTKVGKHIHSQASATLKRTSLELGGKSPFIISNKANLDEAVQTATRMGVFTSG